MSQKDTLQDLYGDIVEILQGIEHLSRKDLMTLRGICYEYNDLRACGHPAARNAEGRTVERFDGIKEVLG